MKDIYSLPPAEQPERFRALFEYLDQQYMELVANYHLMVVPWSNQTVIDRFNRTRCVQGFFKNLDNSPDQFAGISQREAFKYWQIEQGEE